MGKSFTIGPKTRTEASRKKNFDVALGGTCLPTTYLQGGARTLKKNGGGGGGFFANKKGGKAFG